MEGGLLQGVRFHRLAVPVERTSVARFSRDVGSMGEAMRDDPHLCHPRKRASSRRLDPSRYGGVVHWPRYRSFLLRTPWRCAHCNFVTEAISWVFSPSASLEAFPCYSMQTIRPFSSRGLGQPHTRSPP